MNVHHEYDELAHLIGAEDHISIPIVDISSIISVSSHGNIPMASKQSDIEAMVTSLNNLATSNNSVRDYSYTLDDNINRLLTDEVANPGSPHTVTQYIPNTNDEYKTIGGVSIIYDGSGIVFFKENKHYRPYTVHNDLSIDLIDRFLL